MGSSPLAVATDIAQSVRPLPAIVGSKRLDLLFRTSAETLLEIARDPKPLGAEIGLFSVPHTWSQQRTATRATSFNPTRRAYMTASTREGERRRADAASMQCGFNRRFWGRGLLNRSAASERVLLVDETPP
jgi:hypothetical protein